MSGELTVGRIEFGGAGGGYGTPKEKAYCGAAEQKVSAPTLFDLMGGEDAA